MVSDRQSMYLARKAHVTPSIKTSVLNAGYFKGWHFFKWSQVFPTSEMGIWEGKRDFISAFEISTTKKYFDSSNRIF